ncbi:MAG: DUF1254 domain-containing protein [Rhodoferax sp.]|uniref:DUF1254 domain-containing protein n=1 Tax=Rhodoferax sp. TaxID=50421 RepID=UPI001B7951CA|nr:DUF1254 domain-containing protein [Rhodoferax sp.]MBP9904558.1 DUF1254 domain-containing protein [Rhodoferax sp.]
MKFQKLMLPVVLSLLFGAAAPPMATAAQDIAGLSVNAATPLERRIDEAFLEAFPLYEMARTRYNSVVHPLNPSPLLPNGTPVNRRALIDHTSRGVTTPNNDTLYSASWLDLHYTPVRIQLPKVDAGRYWSLALLDIFTNNFAILGSRTDGDGPLDVTVVGPNWQGATPAGRVVRAPSNDVQFLVRTLVNSAADASTVHRLQDGIKITPVVAAAGLLPQWVVPSSSTDPVNFLAVVNEMLSRNPPPSTEAPHFKDWVDLGLGHGADAFVRTSPEVQAAWRQRLPVLHDFLKQGLQYGARLVNGWSIPSPLVGNFGTDYALRATVAFGALSALDASEAVYLNLESDPSGAPLDGRKPWKLVVPPIQAKAFWSLSMYEKESDGRLFFAANPLNRYTIGDRTEGIQKGADGNIELLLQHQPPADTRNWLPTPAGPYAITLRAYLPSDAMRRGEAPLPKIVPAN